jgi:hypothetical protein
MRGVGLALVSCSAALLLATKAPAQTSAPFCLHVYGPITYDDCSYISMEQCRPSAAVEIGKVVHFQGHSDHFGTSPMTIRIGRLISRGNFPGARSDRLARSD